MKTIATVGGLGFCPIAPGTVGSAVGLGIAWVLSGSPGPQALGCLLAIGLGLWSAGPTARKMGSKDPRAVIIDEVAGMMVGVVLLPVKWASYGGAFLLFRFLDVVKPPPLRRIESLPGSLGIVGDDLVAGLVTNVIVRALL